jgi:hypothetical protein
VSFQGLLLSNKNLTFIDNFLLFNKYRTASMPLQTILEAFMQTIQIRSRFISKILQVMMILVPILTLFFWLTVQTSNDIFLSTGMIQLEHDISSYTNHPLTLQTRFWALMASTLPSGILLYSLFLLKKLFKSYENGEIFTPQTTQYYRKLGFVFFYWVLGNIAYGGLISVALSFNNPPGERVLSLSFTGFDILTIFCGFIVLLISNVMGEAQQIADEQQHTI